jgi:hypothetical protein
LIQNKGIGRKEKEHGKMQGFRVAMVEKPGFWAVA